MIPNYGCAERVGKTTDTHQIISHRPYNYPHLNNHIQPDLVALHSTTAMNCARCVYSYEKTLCSKVIHQETDMGTDVLIYLFTTICSQCNFRCYILTYSLEYPLD